MENLCVVINADQHFVVVFSQLSKNQRSEQKTNKQKNNFSFLQ